MNYKYISLTARTIAYYLVPTFFYRTFLLILLLDTLPIPYIMSIAK